MVTIKLYPTLCVVRFYGTAPHRTVVPPINETAPDHSVEFSKNTKKHPTKPHRMILHKAPNRAAPFDSHAITTVVVLVHAAKA